MCKKELSYNISEKLTINTFELQVQPFAVQKNMFSTGMYLCVFVMLKNKAELTTSSEAHCFSEHCFSEWFVTSEKPKQFYVN